MKGAIEAYASCDDIYTPGMIRASFGIYNTEEEIDEFFRILPKAIEAAKKIQDEMNNNPKKVRDVDPTY